MRCFIQKQVDSPRFPVLTSTVRQLKETEGGVSEVCDAVQKYIDEAVKEASAKSHAEGRAEGRTEGLAEGRTEGLAEGLAKGKISMLKSLLIDGVLSLAEAAKRAGLSESEFRTAAAAC